MTQQMRQLQHSQQQEIQLSRAIVRLIAKSLLAGLSKEEMRGVMSEKIWSEGTNKRRSRRKSS